MKWNLKITLIILIVVVLTGCIGIGYCLFYINNKDKIETKGFGVVTASDHFNYNLLKEVNKVNDSNYLVSPLSIAYALSLLSDGALENTKVEIDNALSGYEVNGSINIPNTIGIANALFIKNKYKNEINKNYIIDLKNKYNTEILFDNFNTPIVINNWVNKNTYQMIPKIVDNLDQEFVLGIANAIAIDIKWKNNFECNNTRKEIFTKNDGTKIDTVMMHEVGNSYIENDNAKGIIKDYAIYDKITGKIVNEESENTLALEYVAILPNSDLKTYVANFNQKEFNSLIRTKKNSTNTYEVNLSLPRYSYDYTLTEFQDILNIMGIHDAFNLNSNFKVISNTIDLYVNEIIHKTHIELSENGTKASAATLIMMNKSTAMETKEKIEMNFNQPFIYFIKEKNNNNIWFMGTVYEPEIWNKDTITCTES